MVDEKVEIIPPVSEAQCKKALDALLKWASKQAAKDAENQLLPGKEPTIWLCVALKKSPSGMTFKPVRIPIVHPLVDPRTNGICLLTKDPQREYKELLKSHDIKFISRVIGLEKLKGKFKPFEARRALLKENGLFLADQSIIPLLPKLLGVKWFEAKKQPIPVCMTRKDLKAELERAISSTYMNQNKGTAVSIKIGILSQKPSQILANLKSAIPAVASHIKGGKGGWDNIQSLGVKTNNSMHLPIWSCALNDGEGGRWAGLTQDDEEVDMKDDEGENEDENEEVVTTERLARKGAQASSVAPKGTKKRAVEDEEEDAQTKPKKKAKSRDPSTEDVPSKHKKRAAEASVAGTPVSTDNKTTTKKKRKSDAATPSTDAITVTPKPTLSKPAVSTPEATASITPGQTKKPKTKAAAEDTPVAMQVDPSPSVAPTATAESKPKKKKGKQAEAAAEPTPVEDPTTPSQSQKTKQKTGRASEAAPPTVVEGVVDKALAPAADASKTEEKKKKRKDRKIVSVEDAPAPTNEVTVSDPAADEVVSASTKQSKKQKRKSHSNTEKADVEPVIEAKETVTVETSEEKGEKKKRKKVKKTGIAAGGGVVGTEEKETVVSVQKTPTLSKEELKQKKATGGAGEKKKEKVVKSKGGKSAKNVLLGKKAAQ
ncbi:ribosomal protein L1 [Marasmius fiardii PR-910]|nr:ribosomal protein L1 [Marasmius fiardii PR-910]